MRSMGLRATCERPQHQCYRRHQHTHQVDRDSSSMLQTAAAAYLWPTKRPAMMAYWKSVVGVVRISHRLAASGKGRSGGAPWASHTWWHCHSQLCGKHDDGLCKSQRC